MPNIYIGKDPRERAMTKMLEYSIKKNASKPIEINFIDRNSFSKLEYWRDDSKFGASTEFTYRRFLTPYKNRFKDWAVFCDCDQLFVKLDIWELFDKYNDPSKSCYVIKHSEYTSKVSSKMDGKPQKNFPKHNWASFILFNCAHPDTKKLMPRYVSEASPSDLFQFKWTSEDKIGELPYKWNYLIGENLYKEPNPLEDVNLHYTLFHPELGNNKENYDCPLADIWYDTYWEVFGEEHPNYQKWMIYLKEIGEEKEKIKQEMEDIFGKDRIENVEVKEISTKSMSTKAKFRRPSSESKPDNLE